MRAARPKTGPHPPAFSGFASQLSAHALTALVARDADIAPDLRHSANGGGSATSGRPPIRPPGPCGRAPMAERDPLPTLTPPLTGGGDAVEFRLVHAGVVQW
jgi:hypothetical protein